MGAELGFSEPPAGSTVTPTVSPASMLPESTRQVDPERAGDIVPAGMAWRPRRYHSS